MSAHPDLTLVSMPYAAVSRREALSPALPLGVLKSWLAQHGYRTSAVHAHLDFLYQLEGCDQRDFIFDNFKIPVVHAYGIDILFMSLTAGMADSEASFVRLVDLLYTTRSRQCHIGKRQFHKTIVSVRDWLSAFVERTLSRLDINNCQVFGMSCIHGQLFAAVELCRRLKALRPDCMVVFGGIDCQNKTAGMLLEQYPFIDYVATEEGELPLLSLLGTTGRGESIAGLAFRRKDGAIESPPPGPFVDLAVLPLPDFSEFFAAVRAEDLSEVSIPVYASRGCPWNRCSFCNLPVDRRPGYRAKPAEQFAEELAAMAAGHPECLEYVLVDDDITVGRSFYETVADRVADLGLLLSGHGRADRLDRAMAEAMRRAGFYGIEVGIEALADEILDRIDKGCGVADNLKALKLLREIGIESWSNIIPFFPGETIEDVEETLRTIDRARHLFYGSHLTLSRFALYPRTPIWNDPERYGITGIRLEACEQIPKHVHADGALFTLHAFDQDTRATEDLWARIAERLIRYEETFHPCFYRQVGSVVVVYDYREEGTQRTLRLDGLAAQVFLVCADRPHTVEQAARALGDAGAVAVALTDLKARGVMYESRGRWLALPTRVTPAIERFLAERIEMDAGLVDVRQAAGHASQGLPGRRGLVVIDLQMAMMNDHNQHLPARIRQHIEEHGEAYHTVAFTVFRNRSDSLFARWHGYAGCFGPPDTDLAPDLASLAGPENTFPKAGFSAFQNEDFERLLRQERITDVDLVGMDTDACIIATAFDAFALGIRPRVIPELCASSAGPAAHRAGLDIFLRHVMPVSEQAP
ncbi:MAG: isochorismatase family protein [Solidesulfovibrio sp. DCME]|uniref:isochorismatase family protein n=1 Tax=Solidesulfovibrio sp. DCME TaxID=3447380 RepID=UPI003D153440